MGNLAMPQLISPALQMFQKLIPVYLVKNLEQLLPVSGNRGAMLRELMLLKRLLACKSCIASNHSRREFLPLIGKLSDKVMVEPLHLKNNGAEQLHAMFLQQVLSICYLPSQLNSISELPRTSPMSKYLVAMECQVKTTKL